MKNEKIYVKMFGGFSMEYQGKIISLERNSTTKTNQLLQILFCAGERGIARETLMEQLFGRDEITDPATSLRATVYRLRKCLKTEGFPEDDYVIIKSGQYRWTSEIPTELDVNQFETQANNAIVCELEQDQYPMLRKACELYKGEFLPQLGYEEWSVRLGVHYRNLYFRCLDILTEQMQARGEYEELLSLTSIAAKLYPFEEWQVVQMDCLIALNRQKEAMNIYNQTSQMFFEELGVPPSAAMMRRFKVMTGQVQNGGVIEDIQGNLKEDKNDKGAYFSSLPAFLECYRFVERLISRTGQSAFLMMVTIMGPTDHPMEKGEKLKPLTGHLRNAVQFSLRRGDLYTQYSPNSFLILLMEITEENCASVIKRIRKYFIQFSKKNCLRFQVATLEDVHMDDKKLKFDINNRLDISDN